MPSAPPRSLAIAALAFFLWGIFPLYWRALGWVPAGQLTYLRVLCCLPVLLLCLVWKKQLPTLLEKLKSPSVWGWHLLTASLLGLNWMIFIWATHHQRIMEASLGYFLTPLANVAMGALILREKLQRSQWVAVGLASFGVALQIFLTGSLPWVALSLCATFSLYGLLRKRSPLDSLLGLTVESFAALPLALTLLAIQPLPHAPDPVVDWTLLALSGIITTVPLLAFASAARSLPLSTLGQLQFIAPTIQFLVSLACGERAEPLRMVGFAFIWVALAIYLHSVLRAPQDRASV